MRTQLGFTLFMKGALPPPVFFDNQHNHRCGYCHGDHAVGECYKRVDVPLLWRIGIDGSSGNLLNLGLSSNQQTNKHLLPTTTKMNAKTATATQTNEDLDNADFELWGDWYASQYLNLCTCTIV